MDCKGKSGIAQGLPWQSLQGVQVQSLVGKLISHMPQGLAKFKKKKTIWNSPRRYGHTRGWLASWFYQEIVGAQASSSEDHAIIEAAAAIGLVGPNPKSVAWQLMSQILGRQNRREKYFQTYNPPRPRKHTSSVVARVEQVQMRPWGYCHLNCTHIDPLGSLGFLQSSFIPAWLYVGSGS